LYKNPETHAHHDIVAGTSRLYTVCALNSLLASSQDLSDC